MVGHAIGLAKSWLRLLCALAVLSLAFAHKPPQVMAALLETAVLQLPDGSYADLCLGDAATKHPATVVYCEVCLLSQGTLLPPPDDQSWLVGFGNGLRLSSTMGGDGVVHRPVERPRSRAPPADA